MLLIIYYQKILKIGVDKLVVRLYNVAVNKIMVVCKGVYDL
jgi:hypothetical protein